MGGFKGYPEVKGGRLYYEVTGLGPAVSLAHGFTLDHRMCGRGGPHVQHGGPCAVQL